MDLNLAGRQDTGHGRDLFRSVEIVATGSGDDRLIGDGARNMLAGGAGEDALSGRGGGDRLLGGSGDDRLYGGSGNDCSRRRIGGRSADRRRGRGPFVFAAATTAEVDAIADFEIGGDLLQLSGVPSFGDLDLREGSDGFAELAWQARTVRLAGVEVADLSQDAFAFV